MTKDMTSGTPAKLIVGFAVPLLAGMLFQQLYNMVDTMIVGRFLGVTALAGVGATGSVNFLVLGFCMGLSSGFAIPVAQRFGAKDERRMREYAANGIMLAAAFSAVITLATVVFCRDILHLMNTPEDCFEEANAYISVIFAGIPFTFLYNLLSGYLRSLGDSRTPLMFLVFSSVLNVVLDLLLIVVFRLGVRGASLATVISQAISGLLCILWIARKVPILHARGDEWKIRGARIGMLCKYGVPMGLQYSVTAVGSIILQMAVNGLGYFAVASMTAAGRLMGILACPFDALGSTMATYAAQNVGASRYERVDRGIISASVIGCVYSLCAFVLVHFMGETMAMLFVSGEGSAEIIQMSHRYMTVSSVFFPALALVNVVRFTIQGMGFSMLAIAAGALEMVARAIAGLLLVPALGFFGASLGNPLAWVFADLFLIPAYLRCRRVLPSRVHHINVRTEKAK